MMPSTFNAMSLNVKEIFKRYKIDHDKFGQKPFYSQKYRRKKVFKPCIHSMRREGSQCFQIH